ncbi:MULTISPECIES: hypothetical protein [Arcobacteraceae]|uniref:hypothetical protein n=1 Tax=Arcobacteraceae TaxID=2808963 RepID=UPI00258379CE|nr:MULTISPECIES: hypothetical protein [Arcobacteraceae]MDD3008035.1 hypothetical protein [Arcobacter sp.]
MSNIINEEIEITFSEAKKRFIEELSTEIENLHNDLQNTFKAYSNPNRNAYNQNIYLRFDFDNTIYKRNRLHKLFFVIESLNKLDEIVKISQTSNEETGKKKAPKIVRYDYYKDKDNINLHFNMTNDEVEKINKKNKELSKKHWTEIKKIKYKQIEQMGNIIINFNSADKKNKSHIEFFELLSSILENKRQAESYTKLIFKKAPKHKTIKELTK